MTDHHSTVINLNGVQTQSPEKHTETNKQITSPARLYERVRRLRWGLELKDKTL